MLQLKNYLFLIFFFPALLLAQSDITKHPGYADFGDLTEFEQGDNVTEVFIEEGLIKMVANLSKSDDPQLSNMLNDLKLVKVNIFKPDNRAGKDVRSRIEKIDKELIAKKWERIVKVRDKNEVVNIYVKTSASGFEGLTITTFDPKGEAVFVNIVGRIDLDKIGKLTEKFNIPSLDKVNQK
jgi:hypothetical protein